jgi:hypothetical protein
MILYNHQKKYKRRHYKSLLRQRPRALSRCPTTYARRRTVSLIAKLYQARGIQHLVLFLDNVSCKDGEEVGGSERTRAKARAPFRVTCYKFIVLVRLEIESI